MIRNLKTLGVALTAVFALGAVVASAASAQQAYLTGDGPVWDLTGKDIGAVTANRYTALGTFVHCENSTYEMSLEGGLALEHSGSITAKPKYEKCKSTILGITTDINMNGCEFVVHLMGTTVSPADTYETRTTLFCVGLEDRPIITMTSPAGNCTITVTPNAAGYNGLDIVDTTNGEVDLKGTLTGLSVDAVGAGCPGGPGNNKPASLDAEITITGDDIGGSGTAIGISELGETTNVP